MGGERGGKRSLIDPHFHIYDFPQDRRKLKPLASNADIQYGITINNHKK